MRSASVFVALFLIFGGLAQAANPPGTNAQAFLFVLEFGLGSPLDAAREKIVVDELLSGWRGRPQAELAKFDAYPQIVRMVLALKQADLEPFRKTVEETTRQWLDESPAGDPAVKAVKDQLVSMGRVLIPGDPPLTEMIASAYGEMIAYARLLRDNPGADLGAVTAPAAAVRKEVLAAWTRFDDSDRKSLVSVPALWITMRTVLRYGAAEEKDAVLKMLAGLAPAAAQPGEPASGEIGKKIVNSMVLSSIKQQTFNTYMWSRGFSGWTPTGKF